MAELGIAKFRFKPNGKEKWLSWSKELLERKDEVMQTLQEEGVYMEACFLSKTEDAVYYVIKAESFEKMQEVAQNSLHSIDRDHKEVKLLSIEFVERLEPLFWFERE